MRYKQIAHKALIWYEVFGMLLIFPHIFFPPSILFWTDWDASSPRIEAASMSGDGRRTIHRETGSGGWPNGLTVDYLERRILWIDARYVYYSVFLVFKNKSVFLILMSTYTYNEPLFQV